MATLTAYRLFVGALVSDSWFHFWGRWIVQFWMIPLLVWLSIVVTASITAPPFETVSTSGEFAFLPADSPNRLGEELFAKAFPVELQRSSIVLVVRRERETGGLQERDFQFIDDGQDEEDPEVRFELRERLLEIAAATGGLAPPPVSNNDDHGGTTPRVKPEGESHSPISAVRTFRDRVIGKLLTSADGQATLVLLELTNEFLDERNATIVERVEELLQNEEFMRRIPGGLDISLSGTAVVGRDMIVAARQSAKSTEALTIGLVVCLLIAIYRAPLLALIPLITVFLSVKLTMTLLTLMAARGWVTLFHGIESYVTVLVYGAGVDYCLFLIARYKEELDAGGSYEDSVAEALHKVGAAITASAGTVICGIGMMIFCEFGKLRDAGIAITFGLVIVLLAALSFTPALMYAVGHYAFWPQIRRERVSTSGGWLPTASPFSRAWMQLQQSIEWIVIHRPATVWLVSVASMLPWALVGIIFYTDLSYGLLSDLSPSSPSVRGTNAVLAHFPDGTTGPITVLIQHPTVDFSKRGDADAGLDLVRDLTRNLVRRKDELQLADIRSVSHPFGGTGDLDSIESIPQKRITTTRAIEHYVSQAEPYRNHVTRIELITEIDPFSRGSIAHLDRLESVIGHSLPGPIKAGGILRFTGPTASIRDLKHVTDRDQMKLDVLVVAGVFFILVLLLRRAAISLYLILTVLFSYLVTLGVTYSVFWYLDPAQFAGLDWKVPMFLFTILIAVGEDYNIFLMTRIEEEQREHGPVGGVVYALSKTSRIISSCGIIMAGTFASLMAGSLMGMVQLGFALAFGVLLDTFVVRTILVPAYLIMLYSGRFGVFGELLGHKSETEGLAGDGPGEMKSETK